MVRVSFYALLAMMAVAGCSGGGVGQAWSNPLVQAATSHTSSGPLLYVSNGRRLFGSVSVFPLGHSRPILRISKGIEDPTRIAFDAEGNIYVGNSPSVSVYAPGGRTPIRTLSPGLGGRGDLRFDSKGNLYVAYDFAQSSAVFVYPPGASYPARIIRSGITTPVSLAVDSSDNLYVANQRYPATVAVYAPGGKVPTRTLKGNLMYPTSIAFDPAGNLYVADEGSYGSILGKGTKVLVYDRGRSVPKRIIRTGVRGAVALACDSIGNLYVANFFVNQRNARRGYVAVYTPGSDKPAYELGRDGNGEFFLGLDAQNDLYVGHGGQKGSITVYALGSNKPLQKIKGIDGLVGLAISPG